MIRKRGIVYLSFILFLMTTLQGNNSDPELQKELLILSQWKAGERVSREVVNRFGLDNCFTRVEIDETLLKRIYGKSYKENCTILKDNLRYIKVLHYNLENEICVGELICHKNISEDLLEIFRALFNAEYPIQKMILIDQFDADDERSMQANNTSCFNYRFIPGTSKLSSHSEGYAVDINPRYNPYVKNIGRQVIYKPRNASEYTNRISDFPYKINHEDLCYKEFKKRGFTWGGDWKSLKDYQHFEKIR